MSSVPSHPSSGEHPAAQQPERIASATAVRVAIGALVIFALATIWSTHIFENEERQVAPQGIAGIPQEIGKPEIGIVNQRLFELQREAQQKRSEQLSRLNSYGWVDRDKLIIHLPVDRAMERLASESKP